ncbi:MAG: hypothetical protein ABR507_11820 [Actinomycetota bacterium]|nr:hypothetical protein [Actinomycetota bacterium]
MGREHHVASSQLTERESGQIAGWLVKLVVFIAIGGMLILEAGGVLVARGTVADAAHSAANDAAFAMKTTFSQPEAEKAARETAQEKGSTFFSLTVDQQARTVTVELTRNANTRLVQHISFLKKYAVARARATKSFA